MESTRWTKPVTFEENSRGRYRTIGSTEEAARVLMERWPVQTGKAYRKACEVMLAVLEGRREQGVARLAFLAAADEANVYIRNS
ncbi:hypothetical protein ASG25_10770 [Rhizobium sp. Leaf384]|uniref:DUF982 domain-containing protein n=1 Tax=Rhizobium sp. Leaf384 TaxID=1736358 RepID=UPI000714D391|nr:DUF982 domain-containing protein [Rhizobium sp. Leaf384]KQS79060.1 hypothetical protein ASG25_10770 [Rhizobium sp. Leaf384]